MWGELKEERVDPQQTMYRRIEALLGANPDEGDPRRIERFLRDSEILGEQATDEVAAGASIKASDVMSAGSLRKMARDSGFEVSDRNGASPMTDSPMSRMESDVRGSLIPWQVGADAAKSFRRGERLGEDAISDRALCEMCGIPPKSLNQSSIKSPMAFTLASKGRKRIVFRARVRTGRRFDAARLLGDKLIVQNGEALQPATSTHTFRQKVQRAFAAELLCPIDALLTMVESDQSDESIEEAAAAFKVSPMLVARQLENHAAQATW